MPHPHCCGQPRLPCRQVSQSWTELLAAHLAHKAEPACRLQTACYMATILTAQSPACFPAHCCLAHLVHKALHACTACQGQHPQVQHSVLCMSAQVCSRSCPRSLSQPPRAPGSCPSSFPSSPGPACVPGQQPGPGPGACQLAGASGLLPSHADPSGAAHAGALRPHGVPAQQGCSPAWCSARSGLCSACGLCCQQADCCGDVQQLQGAPGSITGCCVGDRSALAACTAGRPSIA